MLLQWCCCLLLLLSAWPTESRGPLRTMFPSTMPPMLQNGDDPGKPLFLTPYINAGNIDKAQSLSRVGPLPGGSGIESYAGYLTVDKTYNSNMFFWFIPALKAPETAPVLLWLQGGPGGSSLFGLFVESGPFGVDADIKLFRRNVTWSSQYSMLYIDNPVGTGFSFTESDYGYSTNESHVAKNLYNAVSQFFKLFPKLKKNDFYITGESYAGKYLPALAYYHYKYGSMKDVPLKGVAIGDGFTDPENMLPTYADYIFNIGMLDENQREHFRSSCDSAVALIQKEKYEDAFKYWDSVLNGDLSGFPSYFTNCSGSTNYFNYMRTVSPPDYDNYPHYLALPAVRKAIHVGALTYNDGNAVEKHLMNDIMSSVRDWLAVVMDNYRVLIYSGQLDIIVAHPLTEAMLQNMPWKHRDDYNKAQRSVWKVKSTDTEVAGYVRQVKDFTQVVVRGGGHILPYDQPERTLDMLDRFISGRGF